MPAKKHHLYGLQRTGEIAGEKIWGKTGCDLTHNANQELRSRTDTYRKKTMFFDQQHQNMLFCLGDKIKTVTLRQQ